MTTRSITLSALLIALSIVLSYIEFLFPLSATVPGLKIGLANIVTVFSLYTLGFKKSFLISAVRVIVSSILFGSFVTLAYSASGAAVSLLVMTAMKKCNIFGTVAVSIAGGVAHNMTQLALCFLLFRTSALLYYIPVLIVGGIAGGAVVGIVGWTVIKRTGFMA